MKKENRDKILDLTLNELKNALGNIKKGKSPSISKDLRKMFQMIKDASENNATEEDMDKAVEEKLDKIKKDK